MKADKIKLNGKEYQPEFGMDLMEWLGEELKTDDLQEILNHFNDLDFEKLKISNIPKYGLLLRGALKAGGSKDIGQKVANDWCLANPISAVKLFGEFVKTIPGQGESDRELEGNLIAPKEGASA